MKAHFLLLFLIACSYCLEIYQVSKGSRKSLLTYTTGLNYFFLINSEYSSYSSYIYILLEDNGFSLNYSNVKYCHTNINPNYYPDTAISCSFSYASYYDSQTSSSTKKYYYKIYTSSSYSYTIISYSGSYSYGYLYVTTDYNDLFLTMTNVYRNSEKSLPTSISYKKYFYLTNNDYSYYSSYIYIRLEDNNFGLYYSNVKYCRTDTNPYSYPESAVRSCTFFSLDNYNTAHYSYSTKYYYKLPYISSYSYTIISYSGSYSSGSLYVTANDVKFSDSDSYNDASTVIIISVTIGVFIILVVFTIILIRYCTCRRRNIVNNSIPVTQPTYATPATYAYPVNQPAYNYAAPIPIQSAPAPMSY